MVLSGGGARGFAHIGTLRALERRDLRVEVWAGTSMGAIIGALAPPGTAPTTSWSWRARSRGATSSTSRCAPA
jgi:predicted acylesterase/phospholipase RssA